MKREDCRLCGSEIRNVLDLGEFVPSDFVSEDRTDLPRVPLVLAECPNCRLVQLHHTVPRDELYRQYWYLSGLNPSMVDSLRDVVAGIERRTELRDGDIVVDVGANDGTLLTLYANDKLYRVGFDPARNLAPLAEKHCDVFVNDYFETADFSALRIDGAVKALTSIAMFYDLDDPRAFVERVKSALHRDGIWVLQMTDLVRMLRSNAFDNVCHEHLCYYSLSVLFDLLAEYDLVVFDVEFNDVNGGSLRAYVCHAGSRGIRESVLNALEDEKVVLVPEALDDFRSRVEEARDLVVGFVRRERAAGRRFHALGASTKGNTLLQYFRLTGDDLECAAEVNPAKFGLRTAGSGVPIVGQDESLARRPDCYLVLPWHFLPMLREKHAAYLEAGGKLLAPLPRPTLYDAKEARHLRQDDGSAR